MFGTNAVVPVLSCVVNTIAQPELFHATFCVLREVRWYSFTVNSL